MKIYEKGFLALCLIGCLVLGVCCLSRTQVTADTMPGVSGENLDLVSVSGKADVKVTPDKASVSVGVDIKESTASAANSTLGRKSDAIIEALKKAGVKESDIKTTYYSVDETYTWVNNTRKSEGYRGSCSMEVSGIDIDKAGTIIDAAMGAGADSVGRIRYYSSNYDNAYNQALTDAIKAARAKADMMCAAAGTKVVRVHTLHEGYQNDSMKYVDSDLSYDVAESVPVNSASGATVSAGELTITAQVSVQYVIG